MIAPLVDALPLLHRSPLIDRLLRLSPEARNALLDDLSPVEALAITHDWRLWAREKQLPPPGLWEIWFSLGGRGAGKALALDTPIPTPGGWTTMGRLSVGDTVFDERGERCRVTFVTDVQRDHRCYRVTFDDGASIVADAEHRWLTWDKRARKAWGRALHPTSGPSIRTTDEIADSLTAARGREVNHSIETTGALRLPDAALPVDPYVLGAWLGDGTSKSAEITIGDIDAEEMLGYLADAGIAVSGVPRRKAGARCATYPLGGRPYQRSATTGQMTANGSLHSALRALGVMKNKHVPDVYLRGSIAQRTALLQGLMDTDGSITRAGAEFSSTTAVLADAVAELATSLGAKVTVREGRATLYGRDCGPRWRISWTPNIPIFRLRRKMARQRAVGKQANRTRHRYIVRVDPVASVPVCCITVDSVSHLYLAGTAMVPTHNTRTGAEWCHEKAEAMPKSRGFLLGATFSDVRDTMIEGESGLLATMKPTNPCIWLASRKLVRWKNGAQARVFTGEEPERMRGPQHHWGWVDEWAAFKYPREAWDQMMLGKRLGKLAQAIVTSTPKPFLALVNLLKDAVSCAELRDAPEGDPILTRMIPTVVTVSSSFENRGNLSDAWYERTIKAYEGTRLYDQEVLAKILSDVEGALWKMLTIEESRIGVDAITLERPKLPEFDRVVVAVDPAVTSGKHSNETGIMVGGRAAVGSEKHGYLLEDLSGRYTPDQWARKVVDAYYRHKADRVVAEQNQGGDLVKSNIATVDPNVPVKLVVATRGKTVRAEPIAAKYEQRKIHHVGTFGALESQMTTWTPDTGLDSPDRMDAMVWLFTELLLAKQGAFIAGAA
jgi:phage terminase large subunit-like protein